MNKADSQGTAERLCAIVANSLDTQAKTQDLARQAYQSRTQLHRLFRMVVEETLTDMRRRLLLERAAYQLEHNGINIIFTKEVWTAALSGADMDMKGLPQSQRSPQALLQRLEKTDAELHRILGDIRNRSGWDDTFVDALCEPAETFTYGGVFAHIMTFNAHRRLMALDALRQLGVPPEGFGDPMEYEESVAPWNQRVALKTP